MARDAKKLTISALLSNLLILFTFGISPTCFGECQKPLPHSFPFLSSLQQSGPQNLKSKVDEKFIAQRRAMVNRTFVRGGRHFGARFKTQGKQSKFAPSP